MPTFTCTAPENDGEMSVSGDIDDAAGETLGKTFTELISVGADRLIIDVVGVTSLSLTGMNALISAAGTASSLRIQPGNPVVDQLISELGVQYLYGPARRTADGS